MDNEIKPFVVAYEDTPTNSLTKFDLGTLAIRLMGLYLVMQALMYAAWFPSIFFSSGRTPSQTGMMAAYAGPILVYGVGGMLMLLRTRWIARRAFPEFATAASLSITGRDLQGVAFSVLGVWMIASAIPSTAQFLTQWYWLGTFNRVVNSSSSILPEAVRIAGQFVVGIILFAQRRGLSAAWHRLRYAGLPSPNENHSK